MRLLFAAILLALALPAAGQEKRDPAGSGGKGSESGGGSGAEGAGGASGAGAEQLPAPLDGLFEALNPARLQRRLDEALGEDTIRSLKPKAPEIPLAVFVESVRPLGALKYENQFNYFVGTFTGSAPTFQSMTYEYVFADWHAARVEVIAPEPGKIDSLGVGYQRTLGVGPRGNWSHGVLVLPEVSIKGAGFVGGSTFYTLAWKPDEKSPWTVGGSVGANRASFQNRPLAGAGGGLGSMMFDRLGVRPQAAAADTESRVWRPFAAANVWHTFSPKLTAGLEADVYPHPQFGEYLVAPNLTWRPTKHFFVQFAAGWYEIGGKSQAVFLCRLNLLNPSPRKPLQEWAGSSQSAK